ncbi:hypothetical protein BZA05DRAFT_391122 [Tricharina praecox]|uniref:uncharacterized protein n=1 Tax=Tricharina praecox TaxID=43433 RepID=UPI00221F4236|nr:uncharacterized protein BZA05DRAFT_391122 [Tricharina praecox]KAI5855290.1 hypothetical protein BZA05DRAFT_391122 [Tricharina praecox]
MSDQTQTAPTPLPTEPKRYLEPPPNHPANEYTREAVPAVADAVKSISLDDFKKVHTQPCFRDAYLWGMSGGFAVGGLRFIAGGGIPKACNWAVGACLGTSIVTYEYCQYRRRQEKQFIAQASAIMERKRAEVEKKMAERKERAMKAAAEKEAQAAAAKSSWKFW